MLIAMKFGIISMIFLNVKVTSVSRFRRNQISTHGQQFSDSTVLVGVFDSVIACISGELIGLLEDHHVDWRSRLKHSDVQLKFEPGVHSGGRYTLIGTCLKSLADAQKSLEDLEKGIHSSAPAPQQNTSTADVIVNCFDPTPEVSEKKKPRKLKDGSAPESVNQIRGDGNGESRPNAVRVRNLKAAGNQPQVNEGIKEKTGRYVSVSLSKTKHNYIRDFLPDDFRALKQQGLLVEPDPNNRDLFVSWKLWASDHSLAESLGLMMESLISRVVTDTLRYREEITMGAIDYLISENKDKTVHIEVNQTEKTFEFFGLSEMSVYCTINWLLRWLRGNSVDVGTVSVSHGYITHTSDGFTAYQRRSKAQSTSVSRQLSVPRMTSKGGFVIDDQASSGRGKLLFRSQLLTVHVCQGDMLKQQTEVIVNSANNQLGHGGGLARAIVERGGTVIDDESREIVARQGPIKVGEVVHTSAGSLPPPIKYVVHAVPPSQYEMDKGTQGIETLVRAFFRSMEYSNTQLHAKSISLPPFGCGIFNVPVATVMGAAFVALVRYDQLLMDLDSAERHLTEVHIISNDAKTANEMIDAFNVSIAQQSSSGVRGTTV